MIAECLANEPEQRERMWPLLRNAYVAKSPDADVYSLRTFIDDHFKDMMALFRDRLSIARNKGFVDTDIIFFLGRNIKTTNKIHHVVDLFAGELSQETDQNVGSCECIIASAVVDILCNIDIDEETFRESGLLDLCARLLSPSADERTVKYLAYAAIMHDKVPAYAVLRDLLVRSFLGVDRLGMICTEVANCCSSRGPEAYSWLAPFRTNAKRDDWEMALLRAIASTHTKIFAALVENEWRSMPDSLGLLARAYLAARDQSTEPKIAVWEALASDNSLGSLG